jgi:hypothetical protein
MALDLPQLVLAMTSLTLRSHPLISIREVQNNLESVRDGRNPMGMTG